VRGRVLVAAGLLFGAIVISALASGNARRVVGNCTKSEVRPATIIIACADDNLSLTRLRWTTFGATQAHASGHYYVNDCTPNCAAGRFHSYPITLILSKAKVCPDGHDDYQSAAVTFTASRPAGEKSARVPQSLSCPLPG
jgi:hypothetical protein